MPRRTAHAANQAEPIVETSPNFSDDQLIAENFKLEDELKATQKQFDEWAKPYKARVKEIETTLFGRLHERHADSTSTDSGTAYISTLMNTKVEEVAKLFDFLADNWDEFGADIQLNLSKDAVRRYMDENNGLVPPGMSISHFQRLNIRRS
jgi:hypothetical protein